MPYSSYGSCNRRAATDLAWLSSQLARHPESARIPDRDYRHQRRRSSLIALSSRGSCVLVEYLVRQARITDIDRLSALCTELGAVATTGSPLDAADLLRQLVYLPHASVLIAEARKEMAGGAVLALRPSIQAGGFVGTVDLLVVGRGHDAERVTSALVEELLRSAKNKGCATVEVMLPDDPALRERWQRNGFTEAATTIYRAAVAGRATAIR